MNNLEKIILSAQDIVDEETLEVLFEEKGSIEEFDFKEIEWGEESGS